MQLFDYQDEGKINIKVEWKNGQQNVLFVLPTGGGKTVVVGSIVADEKLPTCLIAHRQELVSQISVALNREKIYHKIIGPDKVVRLVNKLHMEDQGVSYYRPNAPVAVAGVDTLRARADKLSQWCRSVKLWVIDEAHHVVDGNKWGEATKMFPNAKGLGVTATPIRADGKGLGRHADGVFDTMVLGPTMRDLINRKRLTDYRIFAPPSDLDLSTVDISKTTGDYNSNKLKKAIKKSHVTGDVVEHYLKIAKGKKGVTFATDVETAQDIVNKFIAAGVRAALVHAKTPDSDRERIIREFAKGEYDQLVNVDLFGEGFDLPAIEVVSFARPTESLSLYMQQFGRALRVVDGKIHALIIDHVGNVVRHGLPDAQRTWTLDRRDRKSKSKTDDAIPVKSCPQCTAVYERIHPTCPHCGFHPIPAARSGPEFVDGDLAELDAVTLAKMRGDIDQMDMPIEEFANQCVDKYMPLVGQRAACKRHAQNQEMQGGLRESIAWWAGIYRHRGETDSQIHRRFYLQFGVDVMTAQTLKRKEAEELAMRINEKIGKEY